MVSVDQNTPAQKKFVASTKALQPETIPFADVDVDVMSNLGVARIRLLQSYPFEAALVMPMALQFIGDDSVCDTAMTDCYKRIWINESFAKKHNMETLMMLLSHEAYHAALMHGTRRGSRIPMLFNVACDMFINAILKQRGFSFRAFDTIDIAEFVRLNSLPADQRPVRGPDDLMQCMLEPTVTLDDTPEEIYERLLKAMPEPDPEDGGMTGVGVFGDGTGDMRDDLAQAEGDGDADGDGDSESQGQPTASDIRNEMARRTAQGAMAERAACKKAGKHMDGWMSRMIDDTLEQKVDWRTVFMRAVKTQLARDDYSARRPSRRGLARGVVSPALRSVSVESVAVCSDTSGSVTSEDLSQQASEVIGIVRRAKVKEVSVAFVDTKVRNVQHFKRGEPINFEPKGGGGTDFRPGFKWACELKKRPAMLVYFTDGYGEFPTEKPPFPVIVVLAGGYGYSRHAVPDWATIIEAN